VIKDFWKKLLAPMILMIIFFIALGFLKSELWSTLIIVACIFITFSIKYYHREWLLLLIGIVIGAICEAGGDLIYKIQYWESGSFFGMPYWLPIFWGFTFIIVYRIGSVIVKE
jgi:hypothetical protein